MFEVLSKGIINLGIFKEIKKFLKMQMKLEVLYWRFICTGPVIYSNVTSCPHTGVQKVHIITGKMSMHHYR